MNVSIWNRLLWKLKNWLEIRYEVVEKGHHHFLDKKIGQEKFGLYTLGTIDRFKIIFYRLIILGAKSLIGRSIFVMNLLPLTTDQLIDRMIHGLLRTHPK